MQFQFQGFKATKPVARICNPAKKFYEVFFIVYAGKQKISKRYKKGINDLRTPGERKDQAEADAYKLWEALMKGWNPLQVPWPAFHEEIVRLEAMSFNQAIDSCLQEKLKSLARGSAYYYNSIARRIKKIAVRTGYAERKITSIERRDMRLLISEAKEYYNWSAKARNQCLAILKSLLSVLIDKDILQVNPAHDIKPEKEPERVKYKRISPKDLERISEHLTLHAPLFLDFLVFIHDTGIRPKELHLIQLYDINLLKREIIVRAEVAKTNRERMIPITDDMLTIIINRDISMKPKEWYLFSNNGFAPGPNPYWPTAARYWWHKFVQVGLGIDAKLYGLKHTGADAKLLAGIDTRTLKSLYGHSSEQMTERYLEELKEIHKQKIIANAPSFSAKVIKMKKAE